MNKISLENFNTIPYDAIIDTGEAIDSPDGLNMDNTGQKLKWVAKKGSGNDWAIYAHFAAKPNLFILSNGIKVCDEHNIKMCVPCDDEVYRLYRR